MSPNSSQDVTLETLQATWERVRDTLPEHLGLRMRRALSWLERAETEKDDDDAAFIFYWIAFNAAYARDGPHVAESNERHRFADYFGTILDLGRDNTIYDAIWKTFPNSIRVLLDNKFVFQPFWNHHSGRGSDDWEYAFEGSKRRVRAALAQLDTPVILTTVFDRLYVLRIQLMHGGATWRSSVNRDQVRDGGANPRLPRSAVRRPDDVAPRHRLGAARLPRRKLKPAAATCPGVRHRKYSRRLIRQPCFRQPCRNVRGIWTT